MRHPKTFPSLDLTALDRVAGGLKLDGIPESTNIEDRRPQWAGGPVPNDVWQKEQDDIAREEKERQTTCDENDPYGDEDAPMDDDGAGDREGDLGGGRTDQDEEGSGGGYENEGDGGYGNEGDYGGDAGGDYGGEW